MLHQFTTLLRCLQEAGKRKAVCESGTEALHGPWVWHFLPPSE
jgi:hypothetical protein